MQEGYCNSKLLLTLLFGSDLSDYITVILLDYLHHENYYKIIQIDLSRQMNTTVPQQINFIGKLEEDMKAD